MSLTRRIELLASPLDRPDMISRAIRWWLSALSGRREPTQTRVIAAERLADATMKSTGSVIATLEDFDCFVAELSLPPGSPDAHRRAIEVRLDDIAPISAAHLSIAVIAVRQSKADVTYLIAMARDQRLKEIADRARKSGARAIQFTPQHTTMLTLRPLRDIARRRLSAALDCALVVALAACTAVAVTLWTERLRAESAELIDQERLARRAVIANEAVRENADLAQSLTSRGVLQRRPGAALDALANINAATPDIAWWSSIRWSPEEVIVSIRSGEATAALNLLAQDALRWSLELSGPISAAGTDQYQAFDVRLKLRTAPPS